MSFSRPDLTTLDRRIRSDIEANMDAVPIVRRGSVLAGIARGLAGAAHSIFGHVDWVYKQVFADTADSEQLERHAGFYAIARAAPAQATGQASATGTDGTVIDVGARLGHENGLEFQTTEAAVIAGGTATVAIEAVARGSDGNLTGGERLVFLEPPDGLDSDAAVAAPGLAGGADAESDDRLRQRLLERLRRPPQGGAAHDYVAWAKSVPGITRVWVTSESLGAVTVRVVADDAMHGPAPNAGELAAVQTAIDAVRPVTADVTVAAPVLLPVDVTLSVTPDTPEVRAAVEASLAALILRAGAPGAQIPFTHIAEAISLAPGETDHLLTAPAADIVPAVGEMPVLGVVTFT
ncbi:MAG: baseplate J/gp47 family protein [Pseudomonadota bacterium]